MTCTKKLAFVQHVEKTLYASLKKIVLRRSQKISSKPSASEGPERRVQRPKASLSRLRGYGTSSSLLNIRAEKRVHLDNISCQHLLRLVAVHRATKFCPESQSQLPGTCIVFFTCSTLENLD